MLNEKKKITQLFFEAIDKDDRVGLEKLLEQYPDYVNAVDNWKHTLLHLATRKGSLASVDALINKGANVNATDQDDITPLHLATFDDKLKSQSF